MLWSAWGGGRPRWRGAWRAFFPRARGGTAAPLDRRPIQLLLVPYRLWAALRAAEWRPALWRAGVLMEGRDAASDFRPSTLGLALDLAGDAQWRGSPLIGRSVTSTFPFRS